MGLPSTLPPKSSTAICAAVTDPGPVGVEAGPFMSVSTPIFTTSSEICAIAALAKSVSSAIALKASLALMVTSQYSVRFCGPLHDAWTLRGQPNAARLVSAYDTGRRQKRLGGS